MISLISLPKPVVEPWYCAWCRGTHIVATDRDGKWSLFYCHDCGSEWFGIWRQLPGRPARWLCPLPRWGQ